jgi:hypothetical protein
MLIKNYENLVRLSLPGIFVEFLVNGVKKYTGSKLLQNGVV